MNGQDRKDIEELKTDVNDLYGCYNDVAESVNDIKTNALVHLEKKVDKAIFRSTINIIGQVAILVALLCCMVALAK